MTRTLAGLLFVSPFVLSIACGSSGDNTGYPPPLRSDPNPYQSPFFSSDQPSGSGQTASSSSTRPLSNPNAPLPNGNQPTPVGPSGPSLVSCSELCATSQGCLEDCQQECSETAALAVYCPAEIAALLACVQTVGLACDEDQSIIAIEDACDGSAQLAEACLERRVPPDNGTGGAQNGCGAAGAFCFEPVDCCSGVCDTTQGLCLGAAQ